MFRVVLALWGQCVGVRGRAGRGGRCCFIVLAPGPEHGNSPWERRAFLLGVLWHLQRVSFTLLLLHLLLSVFFILTLVDLFTALASRTWVYHCGVPATSPCWML